MSKIREMMQEVTPPPTTVTLVDFKSAGFDLVWGPHKEIPGSKVGETYAVKTIPVKNFFRTSEEIESWILVPEGGIVVHWRALQWGHENGVLKVQFVVDWSKTKTQGKNSKGFLITRVVKDPEPSFIEGVVELPIPWWVGVNSEDEWTYVHSMLVPEDEAFEILASFLEAAENELLVQIEANKKAQELHTQYEYPAEPCPVCGEPLTPDRHCWVRGCV